MWCSGPGGLCWRYTPGGAKWSCRTGAGGTAAVGGERCGAIYHRWTITALYRPQMWNKLPDSNGGFSTVAFQDPQTKAVLGPLYQDADVDSMFRSPPSVAYG